MTREPTHAYIGTRACGCIAVALLDRPTEPKKTAAEVRAYEAQGIEFMRLPLEIAQSFKMTRCPHKETPQ